MTTCDLCEQFQRAISTARPGGYLPESLKRLYAEHQAEAHAKTSAMTAPKGS